MTPPSGPPIGNWRSNGTQASTLEAGELKTAPPDAGAVGVGMQLRGGSGVRERWAGRGRKRREQRA